MNENFIVPFQLESSNIRGRVVKLSSVLNDILTAHNYPDTVAKMTGEIVTLCAMLSSMLKFDGIFTLQVQSDGYVRMLVADMVSGGDIRGCATFDKDEGFTKDKPLLGEGHVAFTVDQGEYTERYQGIVELKPEGLKESVQHYFGQSEQIATGMMMHVERIDGQWRAGAVMLQQMPDETAVYNKDEDASHEDDWRRAMILLGSLKNDEMVSNDIGAKDILYRLFHEEGVRVFEEQSLQKGCRCSNDKIQKILRTMSEHDIKDISKDGCVEMSCEFCSQVFKIKTDDILKGDIE